MSSLSKLLAGVLCLALFNFQFHLLNRETDKAQVLISVFRSALCCRYAGGDIFTRNFGGLDIAVGNRCARICTLDARGRWVFDVQLPAFDSLVMKRTRLPSQAEIDHKTLEAKIAAVQHSANVLDSCPHF